MDQICNNVKGFLTHKEFGHFWNVKVIWKQWLHNIFWGLSIKGNNNWRYQLHFLQIVHITFKFVEKFNNMLQIVNIVD